PVVSNGGGAHQDPHRPGGSGRLGDGAGAHHAGVEYSLLVGFGQASSDRLPREGDHRFAGVQKPGAGSLFGVERERAGALRKPGALRFGTAAEDHHLVTRAREPRYQRTPDESCSSGDGDLQGRALYRSRPNTDSSKAMSKSGRRPALVNGLSRVIARTLNID